MPIDAKVEAEKLQTMYKEDPRQGLVSILLTGESGTGKTYLNKTAPFPVHIDSFDPTGTKSVRDYIDKGKIIADVRYEDEDPMKPTAFKSWMKEFDARRDGGYFDSIAVYVLDSATTWTEAVLNYVQNLPKGSGAGNVPVWNKDYHPQKVLMRNYLRKCMSLPCHFIFTGHLEPQKDSEGNVTAYRFLMTGKGAIVIPLLFDEIWVMESKEKSAGMEYSIRTVSGGKYLARSRLAGDGKLKKAEEANLRNIIKKAGLNYQDKDALL